MGRSFLRWTLFTELFPSLDIHHCHALQNLNGQILPKMMRLHCTALFASPVIIEGKGSFLDFFLICFPNCLEYFSGFFNPNEAMTFFLLLFSFLGLISIFLVFRDIFLIFMFFSEFSGVLLFFRISGVFLPSFEHFSGFLNQKWGPFFFLGLACIIPDFQNIFPNFEYFCGYGVFFQ